MENVEQIPKKVYSVPEAASVLGISTTKMYQLIRSQGFPVIVIGKRRVIPIKDFEQWMTKQAASGWQ